MMHVTKLCFGEKLVGRGCSTAVWADMGPRSAAPVTATVGAVVPEMALAVGCNQDRETSRKGSWVPRLANSSKLNGLDRHSLRECVDGNQ